MYIYIVTEQAVKPTDSQKKKKNPNTEQITKSETSNP